MKQLTQKEAITIAESGVWKNWSDQEIVKFQLFQDRLSMDFSRFQEAMQNVLGRSVFTHEFAFRDDLIKEYLGVNEAPTFEEIINLIQKDKLLIIIN